RVRERLVRAHDGLVDILEGAGGHDDDEIVQLLATGPAAEVAARRDRLGKAIAGFDAATIETTHGFCLQVLYGLGTAGDVDREVTLVEDVSDLLEEVVDDLYLRRFAHKPNLHDFTRAQAMDIAQQVLGHPDALVVPAVSKANDTPSIRRRFAKAVREEMERRKQARKILTYDDVLSRLRDTLFDADRGAAACARLRERYDVVLVDEFQDTDPVQWDIVNKAFGESDQATLVLIGDPKQAIYAFRGADVHAYLRAQEIVASQWTLDVNWRSDQGLLDAYDALFCRARLGSAGITYHPVTAAEANRVPRLEHAPVAQPLRVRIVHAADDLVPLTGKRQEPRTAEARSLIARDLAAEVVRLLEAEPTLVTRQRNGNDERTTLHPGHVAVLVRVNKHAVTVREALHAAGVPAVIGGAGSVFATEPAQQWLRLLEALERPTSRDRAALAALTCFVGWTPEQVATADDEWEELHWSLHRWAAVLREQGVASLYETVSTSESVPARVLARPSGERLMTDLRHIAQLLHEAGVTEGLGPAAMATWLGRRIHEAERDADNEERTRRLESDAEAVQVLTIHRSKGLEFPVVLCPYLWDGNARTNDVPVFHDPGNANRRTIDVAGEGNEFAVHQKLELEEGRGEDLRLLYVALTRARHQAVVWWAGAMNSQHSPLARLLFDRGPDGVVGPYGAASRSDADNEERTRRLESDAEAV
ncbi:MAG TPA: UvrD-helicase domain-containing protein, partial [Acidimicrobiales bacterium]|nr:UvrD-helicase domain-containing protein [Acidimicrobiales bacterium]